MNKLENVYANKGRYPEIELEKIKLKGRLDLVLLSSEPYPFKEQHASEIGWFADYSKIVFVDGEMLSWYGSILIKAFDYFKKLRDSI